MSLSKEDASYIHYSVQVKQTLVFVDNVYFKSECYIYLWWSRFISTLQVHQPCFFIPLLKIIFLEDSIVQLSAKLQNRDEIKAVVWTICRFIKVVQVTVFYT